MWVCVTRSCPCRTDNNSNNNNKVSKRFRKVGAKTFCIHKSFLALRQQKPQSSTKPLPPAHASCPSPTCPLTSPPASREFSFKGGKILFAEFVEFPRAQWEKAVCHSSGCKREGTSEGEREGGRRGERGLCRAHVSYATHTLTYTHFLPHILI